MISAKEAYNMAAPKLDEYREFLDKAIRKAADEGNTSVVIRQHPYDMWLYDESKLKDMDAKRCLQELRNLGYAIRQLYRESQFVDTGLIIDWSKK